MTKFKKSILTVTLNPALDEMVAADGNNAGREFVAEKTSLSAGGKGINVSRVLKNLRVQNCATGLLGSCTGLMIKGLLDKERINNDFVRIKGNTRTSLTIMDKNSDTPIRLLRRGPSVSKREIQNFKSKYLSLLNKSGMVVLSGRNAAGVPDSIYAELIRRAKKKNIPVILDTHGLPLKFGIQAKPCMIKPNLREAEAVLNRRLNSVNKLKSAVRLFHKKGISAVFISLGADGAIGSDGENIWIARPPRIKCRNHVGCGDAFIGGLVSSFARREDFRSMLQKAVAAGAANTLSLQPGAVTNIMIAKVINKVKIKKAS